MTKKIGYIVRTGASDPRFIFRESSYTRKITPRGDKIYSKMLCFPVDYEEVMETTSQMREKGIVIVSEPFFLDEFVRDKATKWVEWANSADPKEYDPFAD